jgi:hypothetical protein
VSSIVIGKCHGKNVTIDLDVLLTTRALLTADSGGGKTYALKRIEIQFQRTRRLYFFEHIRSRLRSLA